MTTRRLGPTLDYLMAVVVTIAGVSVIVTEADSYLSRRGQTSAIAIPKQPVSMEALHTKGQPSPAILIEFADFQCPFCGQFARSTLPELARDYVDKGRLLFGFRHLPLPAHPQAMEAAEAAECAGMQGRFWEMYDVEFLHQSALDESSLLRYAANLRLEAPAFKRCLEGETTRVVMADADMAASLGIQSTPAFLVGYPVAPGTMKVSAVLKGARPAAEFRDAIEKAEKLGRTSSLR